MTEHAGLLTEPLLITKLVLKKHQPEAGQQCFHSLEPTPETVVMGLKRQIAEMAKRSGQDRDPERSFSNGGTGDPKFSVSGTGAQLNCAAAAPGDSAYLTVSHESLTELSVNHSLNQRHEEAVSQQSQRNSE
jgi:hypothetical protein